MNGLMWQAEYTRRREKQQRALRQREERLQELWPELVEWKKRKGQARVAYGMAEVGADSAALKEAEAALFALQEEMEGKLRKLSLPLNFLSLQYNCIACRDYGIVEGRPCECLRRYRSEKRVSREGWSDFQHQNFNVFNADVFPEEEGQRKRIQRAREICEAYATQCPLPQPRNLLLIGNAGLGKTYLLNCIGKQIIDQGGDLQKIKAYRFHQMLMNRVIGDDDERPYRRLVEADVLLFDDLGSEPRTNKSLTESYFFALLDERISAQRATVISTNLTDEDLYGRYGERGISRLFDRNSCKVLAFRGRDVRLLPPG